MDRSRAQFSGITRRKEANESSSVQPITIRGLVAIAIAITQESIDSRSELLVIEFSN